MSSLRRYTSTTCTLEISGQVSPLSRWSDRAILQQVRFQLHLKDRAAPPLAPGRSADLANGIWLKGDRAQLELLSEAVEAYLQSFLAHEMVPASAVMPDNTISLQPQGLVSHVLHLGNLATPATGALIALSTTQLSDLAEILAQFQQDAMTIPRLHRPAWAPSPALVWKAAAMLVATISLGAIALRVLQPSPWQMAKPTNTIDTPTGTAQAPEERTALAPPVAGPPTAERQRLPTTAAPAAAPAIGASPTVPPIGEPPAPAAIRSPSPIAPDFPPPLSPATLWPPPGTMASPRTTASGAAPSQPVIAEPPTTAPPGRTTSQNNNGAPLTRSRPSADSLARPMPAITLSSPSDRSATAESLPVEASRQSSASPPPMAAAAGQRVTPEATLREVQQYFVDRWQPPPSLNQTLEYRLILVPDGSLLQVIPIGSNAERYLAQTGMPALASPFISPLSQGNRLTVRLVLFPDRRVQTFLEDLE